MSTDPTHSPASVPLRFAVITVSTSRSEASGRDDRSGAVIAEACVAAGHAVTARALVADDPQAIVVALDEALGKDIHVIVLTGGTGISARDCTPSVVRGRIDRELPGFGEIFRMLSYEQVGSKAMLSSAIGGVGAGKAIFALPGSPRACTLAMERLILPEVGHILAELAKESALPLTQVSAAPVARLPRAASRSEPEQLGAAAVVSGSTVPAGVSLSVAPDAERMDAPPIASGWEAGLRGLRGTLERVQPEIPQGLLRMQPVVDVLNSAGARAVVRLSDGRQYGAYGFPDLARRSSKVLLVREAEPVAEIVALHRWPALVGLCADDGGVLPDATLAVASFTEDRCGRAFEGPGQIFAVDGGAVWIEHNRRVLRWDGSRSAESAASAAEPLSSALSTLVLSWSGR